MATCLVPFKDEAYLLGLRSVTDSTVSREPKLPTSRAAHNAGYGRGLAWGSSHVGLVGYGPLVVGVCGRCLVWMSRNAVSMAVGVVCVLRRRVTLFSSLRSFPFWRLGSRDRFTPEGVGS